MSDKDPFEELEKIQTKELQIRELIITSRKMEDDLRNHLQDVKFNLHGQALMKLSEQLEEIKDSMEEIKSLLRYDYM